MDEALGLTATEWTAAGTVAAALSLVATVVIALMVQMASRRAGTASARLQESVAELARRGRRDDLLQQLRVERDSDRLRLLVEEARRLASGREAERLGMEKAYFTNPAGPLLTSRHLTSLRLGKPSKRVLVEAVVDALPDRYRDVAVMPSNLADEVAGLTRAALAVGASSWKIARYVVDRASDDWAVPDGVYRQVVGGFPGHLHPPSLRAASDYLEALQRNAVPARTLVNVVGGVSLAIWHAERSGVDVRTVAGGAYTSYITLMQRNLARIGTEADASGMTLGVAHAVASMVRALGLFARGDAHLDMRALEALVPLLATFEGGASFVGPAADHMTSGASVLLASRAPRELRARLRDVCEQLVPEGADGLDRLGDTE